jgi:hypothetical protein
MIMDKSHPICTQYRVGTILEEYWDDPYNTKHGTIHMLQIVGERRFIEIEFFDGKKWCPPIVDWDYDIDAINREAKFIDHGIEDQGSY